MYNIPLSVPLIQGNEWQYIRECLDTEWVSSVGKYVNLFEKNICALTGAAEAVACINGTAALQIALKLIGIKDGDEVIVPTLTFIAPINAVRYCNASPVFMDCDQYYNIDVEKTVEFIKTQTVFRANCTYNKKTNNRIAAIIAVHVFGNAVDLYSLIEICKERNIKIIEDAAESIGTYYNNSSLNGAYTGTVGAVGCLSFNGNKIITTGGGGMIITNNKSYANRARYLTAQAKDDKLYYIHNEVGYNYRLTNIQAAMGVAQLENLPQFIKIKKRKYELYKRAVNKIQGLQISEVPSYANSNYWFYPLKIDKVDYRKSRDELMEFLGERGIQSRPVWHLNHLQKPYKIFQSYKIENAYILLEKTLNIPCSVGLKEAEVEFVIQALYDGKQ